MSRGQIIWQRPTPRRKRHEVLASVRHADGQRAERAIEGAKVGLKFLAFSVGHMPCALSRAGA